MPNHVAKIPNFKRLWQRWLRIESPRRSVVRWSNPHKTGLLLVCCLVAIISSWHFLVEPDLKPGVMAPFDAIAPKDALVEDSQALQQKRSDLIPRTFVQVIDKQTSQKLLLQLEKQLIQLELVANSSDRDRIGPINLLPEEEVWLNKRSSSAKKFWEDEIYSAAQRMLSQGLINTLAIDQLENASSLQLNQLGEKDGPAKTLGSRILANTFFGASNLKIDAVRSQRLLEELITKQGIPNIQVSKGDLITRKGDVISSQAFDVLDYFGLVKRSPKPFIWLFNFSLALAGCGILILIMRREKPCLQPRHGFLALGLLVITQASKVWFGAAVSPLAVLVPPTLLLSQGIGTPSALAWMSIASLFWPVPVSGIGEGRMLVACIAAAIVAFQGGRMRSRAQLLQMAVLLPFAALIGEWAVLRTRFDSASSAWGKLAPNSEELVSEALVMGAMLMLTILLIPIIENAFGLITRARLMELADHERPLLRRLSSEAPGTFEHTLMICGMAEEGARSIGADVDLIRTGALYHDVGKLYAPKWFIENQTNDTNPHDEINDPFASANVLQAHVDEGLKLARRHRLPRPIADFIPEHQGTLKMGYFLHRAKEIDPSITESQFRYKGPIPRSRETGILMLADGCEAALRSLDPKTTDEAAYSTVRKIVESRLRDGQLKESSLNRAEIELVIRSFVKVWRRMRHRRIAYPINSPSASTPA